MTRAKILQRALLFLTAIGLAVGGDAISESAYGQPYPYYQCPAGYYWDPYYGCLPLSYFYGPPYYAYPDLGFGFFYGIGPRYPYGRGAEIGRGVAPRGGRAAPRGGGGAPRGGGRR